jgi:hypothetical protein
MSIRIIVVAAVSALLSVAACSGIPQPPAAVSALSGLVDARSVKEAALEPIRDAKQKKFVLIFSNNVEKQLQFNQQKVEWWLNNWQTRAMASDFTKQQFSEIGDPKFISANIISAIKPRVGDLRIANDFNEFIRSGADEAIVLDLYFIDESNWGVGYPIHERQRVEIGVKFFDKSVTLARAANVEGVAEDTWNTEATDGNTRRATAVMYQSRKRALEAFNQLMQRVLLPGRG